MPNVDQPLAQSATNALLFGNLVIGVGVMIVPGMLNHLATDLKVSIPVSGHLISIAALVMAVGAPFVAASTSKINRRALLCVAQMIYLLGALLCALMPSFAALLPMRAIMVVGAAIFTPQAAATIGLLVPPEKRSTAVATIFMGWSISSVIGMPLGNLIAANLGWRYGFFLIAGLALISAIWTWRVIPAGLTVPKLSFDSWKKVLSTQKLMTILLVTLVSSSGQFTLLAYIAPYLAQHMNASPVSFSLLMALNGLAGVAGTFWVTKNVGRRGVEKTVKNGCQVLFAGILIWALETLLNGRSEFGTLLSGVLISVPITLSWTMLALGSMCWGAGSFATNSTQQARLAGVAPNLASASISLNTSAMYAGQSIGAVLGGLTLSGVGYAALPWIGAALLFCALVTSNIASRLTR
jgi:MFS transporter, DHA1 family, inner membrane transport protein